jgi:hypothetical protein
MKYEVIENAGQWIVRRDEVEIGRFATQDQALGYVAESLREGAANDGSAWLSMRYERRTA